MPKSRKTNKHLPPRVYYKHNAYYYVDLSNKWYKLGKNLSEAMSSWIKVVNPSSKIKNMNQLFDRYMSEVAPLKSPRSYKANIIQINWLRIGLGHEDPKNITPVDVYKYLDIRGKKAKVAANREKSLLSHVFSMAIRWGIVSDNPCRNVKRIPEKPRERYIEDWEFLAVRTIAPELIKQLMDFAYLTSQRIGDILKIKLSDLNDNGIKIDQSKTKVKLMIQWTEELKNCVERIKKLPRSNLYSLTLFCNRKGGILTYDGFSSVWDRTMKKALSEGLLKESFTFHDIRAKSISDAKNRQQASELAGHADIRITERVYIRNYKEVKPIK